MLKTQPNARIHLLATVGVVVAGVACTLTVLEWIVLALTIGAVWTAEAFNTALESLADEVSLAHRERIKHAKDVAAFAVLVTAITAIAVAIGIFGPHLWGH